MCPKLQRRFSALGEGFKSGAADPKRLAAEVGRGEARCLNAWVGTMPIVWSLYCGLLALTGSGEEFMRGGWWRHPS